MKAFWDERYSQSEYIYGTTPNEYLKAKLAELKPGKILFPAEGEGRNAVYAASLGWEVEAFDISNSGKEKAEKLAKENGVAINYNVVGVSDVDYEEESFDALALVFAHFPEKERKSYHTQLTTLLKSGGTLILEGFSKEHQHFQSKNPSAGGPRNIAMLYDLEEIKADFPNFDFLEVVETETVLSEGEHHKGEAAVIRILAIKK